uniref:Uncharacterized protein n=1 Tax=Oncorhynchus mykiss TaxID=8022 RepID=A0A8C7M1D4_ONCMY
MDSLRRFQDDGYKNWIKTTMGLNCLKMRLGDFLENEIEIYHRELRKNVNIKLNGAMENTMSNQVHTVCKEEVCEQWRVAILANHKGGQVYWNHTNPYLWPTRKWEVAKVHMNGGNGKHTRVEEFDISAFLNLKSHCLHFRKFAKPHLFTPVTNARNKVMYSDDFRVERKDLELFLGRIKELGQALETHSPELRKLAEEIEQLQNTDFSFIVNQFGKNWLEGNAEGNAEAQC